MPPLRNHPLSAPVSASARIATASVRRIMLAGCGVLLIEAGCSGFDNDNVLARAKASGGTGIGGLTGLAAAGNGGTISSRAEGASSVTLGGKLVAAGGALVATGATAGTAGSLPGAAGTAGSSSEKGAGAPGTATGGTFGAAGAETGVAGTTSGTAGATAGAAGAAGSDPCSGQCMDGRVCRKVVNSFECVTASCAPELVTTLKLRDESAGLVVLGEGYAYVVTKTALEVADIHNPREPKVVGELTGNFVGIALNGNRVYLADTTNGLVVVDVGVPEQPKLVTTLSISGGVNCVRADGAVAYLCAGGENEGSGYLQVVDLAQADRPVLRGKLAIPPGAYSIDSAGPWVYLVDGDGRFVVVDASNLDQPSTLASLGVNASHVKLSGSRAFVGGSYEILVLDVTEPARPIPIATIQTQSHVRSLDVDGDLVGWATADGPASHFVALDVSDLAQPISSGILGSAAFYYWAGPMVALKDRFAYVATYGALQIYDLESSFNRRIVRSYAFGGGSHHAMEMDGSYLYAISTGIYGWGTLQVMDIRDPLHPYDLGSLSSASSSFLTLGLAVRNQRAYLLESISDQGGDLLEVLVNVHNPSASTQLGALELDSSLTDKLNWQVAITPAGDTLYLLGDGLISIVRVGRTNGDSLPLDPELGQTLELPGMTPQRIRTTSTHAFVTASVIQGDSAPDSGAFLVFDLADPAAPILVAKLATSVALAGIELAGMYAYVGAVGQGLLVIDLSNPSAPRVVGTAETPQGGEDELVVLNDMVYLGKAAVDVRTPAHPVFRYQTEIPGRLRRLSPTGRLFTISDEYSNTRYDYQPPRLNYVDPTRCAP